MSALPELRAEIDATDALTAHIRTIVDRVIQRDVERGAKLYMRGRDLGALIRNWDLMSDAAILRTLEGKVRSEMARLIAGHWTGDHNRLVALKSALAAEKDSSNQ